MPTDQALLNDANSLASGMHPPFSPTFCPGCFVVFTDNITFDSDATLQLLQTKSHSFWDKLIAFVCADWTPVLHASVARLLLHSFVHCHRCIPRRTRVTREALDDFLDPVMDHACMTLQICLVSRIGGQAKGFYSKRGRWPKSADQLFPYGPERTMKSLVDQMSLHPLAVTVITGLVSVHRPLAFPVLIQEETRGRFISAVVDRLAAAAAAAEADSARIGPTIIPAVKDALAHRNLNSCSHILFMLRAVEVGVDSKDSDRLRLTHGREVDLLKPLDALLSLFSDIRSVDQYVVELANRLWHTSSRARRREKLEERRGPLPSYVTWRNSQDEMVFRDPYRALRYYLRMKTWRRGCNLVECEKQVHDRATPALFSRCAKCRVVQYCSRDCQKADWTHVWIPHRDICDMLQELSTFARVEMDSVEFADACRAHCFPLKRVDSLIEWATNGRVNHDYANGATFLLRSLDAELKQFSEEHQTGIPVDPGST